MRRLAMPVPGAPAALLALSLTGLAPGEGGVAAGIFGVAFGPVPHLAGGTGPSDNSSGDSEAFSGGDAGDGGSA